LGAEPLVAPSLARLADDVTFGFGQGKGHCHDCKSPPGEAWDKKSGLSNVAPASTDDEFDITRKTCTGLLEFAILNRDRT
jgi:hypothetical protein